MRPLSTIPHQMTYRDLHPKPRAHWYSPLPWLRDPVTVAGIVAALACVAAAAWRMQ